jgi:hypothetical protein
VGSFFRKLLNLLGNKSVGSGLTALSASSLSVP